MKLTIGIALNLALFIAGPLLLEHFGLLPPLNPRSDWVLVCAALGILLTTLVGTTSAAGFHFHRQGVDYCKATFGAALSALSLQIIYLDDATQPPLPGYISSLIKPLTPYVTVQRLIFYFASFVIGLIAAWFTSLNSATMAAAVAPTRGALPIINMSIGMSVYVLYVMFLVVKG